MSDAAPLVTLTAMAEVAAQGGGMAVTVCVDGAWISGRLVGVREYVDAFLGVLQAGVDPADPTSAEFVDGFTRSVREWLTSQEGEGFGLGSAIHIVQDSGPIEIRIDRVSAFMLGERTP